MPFVRRDRPNEERLYHDWLADGFPQADGVPQDTPVEPIQAPGPVPIPNQLRITQEELTNRLALIEAIIGTISGNGKDYDIMESIGDALNPDDIIEWVGSNFNVGCDTCEGFLEWG